MDAGERSVIATLAYYGALRWPLTAVELATRLIPPQRLGGGDAVPDLDAVLALTERLANAGAIRSSGGLYINGEHPVHMESHRIQLQTVNARKWRRMLRVARWFQFIPYVRMLAASGSLAMGATGAQSDWDLFVVVSPARLYTARLGLLVSAWLMRRLRTKRMHSAPDRFCFNHILTSDGLALRHRSLFIAQALSWLVPFYDPWGYAQKLQDANHWTVGFVHSSSAELGSRHALPVSRTAAMVRSACESVLDTFIGDIIERLVCRWMRQRIAREPATYEKGGRIVADDRELEFHPHSFEAVALARYNAALVQAGLGQYAEHDSGLTR